MRTRPRVSMSWIEQLNDRHSLLRLEQLVAEWVVVHPGGMPDTALLAGHRGRGLRVRILAWMQGLEEPHRAGELIADLIRAESSRMLGRAWRVGIAGETLELLGDCLASCPVASLPDVAGEALPVGRLQAAITRLLRLVECHLDAADLRFVGFWPSLERLAALAGVVACLPETEPKAA